VRRLTLWLLLPASAQANDSVAAQARLSVERSRGAEQCLDRPALERRVTAISGRAWTSHADPAELAIAVRFERNLDGAFVARVAVTGPKPGQRLLRDADPTCDALSEAVSVAIALLLDDAHTQPSERPTKPAGFAALPAVPAASNVGAPSARADARSWQARASLEAAGGYGLAGAGVLLGLGRVGARHRHWLLDLALAESLPAETSFERGAVRASLLFGSARACYLLGQAVTVAPCVHVGLGRLRGEGRGYGQAQSSSLPWTAAGLGLVSEAPLGPRLYAAFGATLWVPTRRQTFSVENAGIAWESKPIAGLLSAGLGLRLF